MKSRWHAFTEEELQTIALALADSGGMRSDHAWYHLRCSKLHAELVKAQVGRWIAEHVIPPEPISGMPDASTDETDSDG